MLKIYIINFIYNFIIYDSSKKEIIDTFALNVYELNWDHLKIQNLGKGQLQISNMVEFLKSPKTNLTREEWKDKLKEEAIKQAILLSEAGVTKQICNRISVYTD